LGTVKKTRILLVDDDKTTLESLKGILELEGYMVDTAETGKQALEKTKTQHYNLALLEIRLPDMEGTELLTGMSMNSPQMRTIIITGYPSLENTVESLNRGADAYIVKPIDCKSLLDVVYAKLREREAVDRSNLELAVK
jgi:DNA-binding response OmpR family regulator